MFVLTEFLWPAQTLVIIDFLPPIQSPLALLLTSKKSKPSVFWWEEAEGCVSGKFSYWRAGELCIGPLFTPSSQDTWKPVRPPAQLRFLHPQAKLVPAPWTAAKGHLTPTLLLERHKRGSLCSGEGGLIEDKHFLPSFPKRKQSRTFY